MVFHSNLHYQNSPDCEHPPARKPSCHILIRGFCWGVMETNSGYQFRFVMFLLKRVGKWLRFVRFLSLQNSSYSSIRKSKYFVRRRTPSRPPVLLQLFGSHFWRGMKDFFSRRFDRLVFSSWNDLALFSEQKLLSPSVHTSRNSSNLTGDNLAFWCDNGNLLIVAKLRLDVTDENLHIGIFFCKSHSAN